MCEVHGGMWKHLNIIINNIKYININVLIYEYQIKKYKSINKTINNK